ncbi:MAG: hypothetical protein JNJ54_04945 [Myxococcaceae bacterium]|nr:hypothetical protein [Myxococcaceae bacterium]
MPLRRRIITALLLLAALACPRADTSVKADRSASVIDAGTTDPEAERLRVAVKALSSEARAFSRALDERLWAAWTTGASLDVGADGGRAALLAPERRAMLSLAIAQGVDDPHALEHLALFLESEHLAESLRPETEAIAQLEASLTFSFEGKDVRWADLTRLLATEKSALKRKALWTASLVAAAKLDAALAAREAKAAQVLAPRTPFVFATELRDVDPEAMRRVAEGVLLVTSEAWRLTLERLNAGDTKLPIASLTRADLPRLMRVPADVELAFGKKQIPTRAISTLSALGLYGLKGLSLELSEGAKKNPLPLTVTPGGPEDVRLSFRPLGGLRDQQLLYSELGVALALRHVTVGRFEFERLGDTALAQASGALFASLVGDDVWLQDQGLQEPARRAIIDAFAVQRLFQARRAAAAYLVRLDCLEKNDEGANARAAAIFTRALGVLHTEADMVRVRLDVDEALRSATTLRAMLLGDHLRSQLDGAVGGPWFKSEAAARALVELWRAGSSVPVEARVVPLGDALTAFWKRTLELTPVGQRDGGLAIAEWPAPKTVEPQLTIRPWPRERIMSAPVRDGGWVPRPWPQPKSVEPRWVPRPWPQPQRVDADAGVP